MSNYVRLAPIVSTTAVLISSLAWSLEEIPPMQYNNSPTIYEIRGLLTSMNAQTQYKVVDDQVEIYKKIETVHKFASILLENIEDLDPEFSKIIDENYWDLI